MRRKKISLDYFAGLFDGEGCIFIQKKISTKRRTRNLSYRLGINLATSGNPELIEIIKKQFGGSYYRRIFKKRENKKPSRLWVETGIPAAKILKLIQKLLYLKKGECKLALLFQKYRGEYKGERKNWKKNYSLNELRAKEKKNRRLEEMYQEMRALKTKRY